MKRAAAGDYTPDPKANRFPTFEEKASGITLSDLFDKWQAETKPAGSTATTWRRPGVSPAPGHGGSARLASSPPT
ncbi:hypothetical protein [Methylobacterium sp. WL12]|uniref:hypothetical protein n=1 Tax=Methylobacterium sp. WL12 TaxID=2603890 RepID=UPI00164F9259|nr:hypothetical protein [Methylobacterium sp. WL12]